MRALITVVMSAATMVVVAPALAERGSADRPVQVGVMSGLPEKDSFGLLCSRDIGETGSVTAATRAEIAQVGMSTGDPEKNSFGQTSPR
jgi:hypothetical protein